MARLLITGGAGFIGSHTCLVLLEAGHDLVVLDDFSNSSPIALERVQELAGVPLVTDRLELVRGDLRDAALLERMFSGAAAAGSPIEAVIHFAGLKAVGESVAQPLRYWDVNVGGSRALLSAMDAHGCRVLVFSSTSTVYGEPEVFPLTETTPTNPIHPYAQTKLAVEQMLHALSVSGPWRVAALRYFNPVGAHPSGRIGEDPLGIPNNLFPFITQIAAGRLKQLKVFGNDYPTPDGTGIRDYLHVMDLAEAHSAAVEHLLQANAPTSLTLNLGTGQGLSVLDVVHGFETATGITIPYEVVGRRPGDVPKLEACPKQAEAVLGWKAQRSLADMCRDGWAWQSANPQGYRGAT
ncbi:UDP-glucose 4-epimerase [Synechococcus sp. RS9909]|uniref:UDP-glucose 4-epimerase GalE n=1 Tax=unclassified Synechococcus TaxID=2626047 RepID=UPI00006906C1|nr:MULTISPECIES: UDP-glucose 4-epimerase GalE [unclassified Synechococcus]EAQ70120.1 UDP-glucose 4-epimerase [Synechococcus sp. RS9917]QNI78224.1 UDP-glucose 4-epimerase [Synechococcus sp. RS9909]